MISCVSPGVKMTVFSCSGLSASLVEIEMKSSSTSIVVMIVASLNDSMSAFETSGRKKGRWSWSEPGYFKFLTISIEYFFKPIMVMMF